jgi:opacity protein-like surface antigen
VENEVGGDIRFQHSQNVTFRGGYCWDSTWFLGEGGTETIHSLNVEGNYQRWRQHNFRAGYTISLIQSRNGKDDIVHDFDVGDDFISQREIRLTPTLTVKANTGLAVLTSGQSKFRVKHKLNLEVVKVWRAADLTLGVRRGLTGSIGVSGPSYTTEFFSRFTLLISRRLTAFAETEFASFDAEDADFTTFQAVLGLQYWLTSWLSANLGYNYSWVDSQDGTAARETLGRGKVDSNTVFLFFAAHFDLWPRLGLGRGDPAAFGMPSGTPARRSLRSQPRP